MSEPKAISFRCFCFECEAEDGEKKPAKTIPKAASPAFDQEEEIFDKPAARRLAGTLERLLFGA
ncbi:hypothetical protein G6L85_10170 [Agrobacterium rhizogenes]|uniref:hypothetical protein n=1 Tax=Rhizobium rhizogenes TaxID=359 RepID=UPI00056C45E6|nr:hypothetical protein [Rhizobium rhizogenes]NTF81470.1 hypothetical protein [Rhizobium rhizogenes]NTH77488.1 hypothetical protein [Rhizobium rhizogenes]NTH83496.1 hypothetical protein [Rhizobium rhizogenes]NTI61872.1 hypothetical protein [Rhizobium rhizogenes]